MIRIHRCKKKASSNKPNDIHVVLAFSPASFHPHRIELLLLMTMLTITDAAAIFDVDAIQPLLLFLNHCVCCCYSADDDLDVEIQTLYYHFSLSPYWDCTQQHDPHHYILLPPVAILLLPSQRYCFFLLLLRMTTMMMMMMMTITMIVVSEYETRC